MVFVPFRTGKYDVEIRNNNWFPFLETLSPSPLSPALRPPTLCLCSLFLVLDLVRTQRRILVYFTVLILCSEKRFLWWAGGTCFFFLSYWLGQVLGSKTLIKLWKNLIRPRLNDLETYGYMVWKCRLIFGTYPGVGNIRLSATIRTMFSVCYCYRRGGIVDGPWLFRYYIASTSGFRCGGGLKNIMNRSDDKQLYRGV